MRHVTEIAISIFFGLILGWILVVSDHHAFAACLGAYFLAAFQSIAFKALDQFGGRA